MTVSTGPTRNDYDGNGVAYDFPYTFRIFAATDLLVTVRDLDGIETVLTYGTDYDVTNVNSYGGGSVITTSPLTNGWHITILLKLPVQQKYSFRNQGSFFPQKHEDSFDYVVMLQKQQQEEAARSITVPVTMNAVDTQCENFINGGVFGLLDNKVTMMAHTGAQQTADLANTTSTSKGAGMVGHNDALAYGDTTVGGFLNKFKQTLGAGMSGFAYALAYASNTVGAAIKAVMDRVTTLETNEEPVGQCVFAYVNSATCRLSRKNGRFITIGGVRRTLQSAGADLSSTGLNASTLYYVYAYWTGTAVALEASTTGHSVDANTGVEIKTGDASRTLVGMVYCPTAATFADSETQILVSSWFNRRPRTALSILTSGNVSITTTSFSEVSSSLRLSALSWAGDSVSFGSGGSTWTGGAYSGFITMGIDAGLTEAQATLQVQISSGRAPFSLSGYQAMSEGYHFYTPAAKLDSAGNVNIAQWSKFTLLVFA
jgi:hypothetical protein